ncbi:hypothetical protein ACP70R_009117 [Stipagrostis hirtigluma subsp. patula]
MRTKVIKADTIDAATERILDELKGDTSSFSRENVIYFDGWDGLGASAVLRAVAQRLATASEAPAGLQFDQIIHIDCSKWENRRAMQRLIAEQLELPAEVMELFDSQDEEDDFHGVAQGSRAEIPQVLRVMHQHIQELNRRFLVIFHNGSSEEIDLASFGFPLSKYLDNKVLWTFQGRFRLFPRMKVDKALQHKSTGTVTDVFISASFLKERDPQELWSVLVHQEASEVAQSHIITNTAEVAVRFFWHMLKLCCIAYHFMMDYDLAKHACNYWICDSISQQPQRVEGDDADELWRAANALHLEMRLDVDYYQHNRQYFPSHLIRYAKSTPHWTSPPYGFLLIPAAAIPNADMFQDFDSLTVLKLSHRTFSFSSPPFLHCHRLKFLSLEHCQDQQASSTDGFPQEEQTNRITTDGAAGKEEDIDRCFQRLWVLDMRYTGADQILSAAMMDLMTQLRELNVMGVQDWDMGQLQGRLLNIRKLRVTKSTIRCSSCSEKDLFSEMNKMELLDFSENSTISPMTSLSAGPGESSNISSLETIIIDGSVGLREISLKGCAKLKSIFLRGLFQNLYSLDISGTAVKTLDLSTTTTLNLDEVYLLGVDKLCAILWPPKDKRKSYVKKLCIDTTQSTSTSLLVMHGGQAPSEFNWCIWVRDARLLVSLAPVKEYFLRCHAHVEVSSPIGGSISKEEGNKTSGQQMMIKLQRQTEDISMYADVAGTFKDHLLQAREGGDDAPTITQTLPCPRVTSLMDLINCYSYLHVQDKVRTKLPPGCEETRTSITIPDFICDNTRVLHVHDSLSITCIPGPAPALGSAWNYMSWCRVERCPMLDCVFTTPQVAQGGQGGGSSDVRVFYYLRTFWASQLPKAHSIWNWTEPLQLRKWSFGNMEFLHVDFCPSLIYVLPLPLEWIDSHRHLRYLETLEIVWCGELKEVFPLYTAFESHQKQQEQSTIITFPSLKYIHLHELPKLQGICGRWRMCAPQLETVKIRGCWSLSRLPAVGEDRSRKVKCDCEKDWWDKLEWDGVEANHHPSLYDPTHSRYYKRKTLLRGSVLR